MNRHLLHALVAFYIGLVAAVLLYDPTPAPPTRYIPIAMASVSAVVAWLMLELHWHIRKADPVGDADALRKGEPPVGAATLFVYRDQLAARTIASAICIDDTHRGDLRAATFFRIDLEPGQHDVRSSMATLADAAATITLRPGGRIYLRVALRTATRSTQQRLEIAAAAAGDAAIGRLRPLLHPDALARRASRG